jgi:hypothetical protein
MPRKKKPETEEVLEEPVEEQEPAPEKEEPQEETIPEEAFIDLDQISLVFDKSTVELWLSKAGSRIINAVPDALIIPQALPEKQAQTILVFAISAVKPGGMVVVPESLLGSEFLEPLDLEGAVGDFFAFRK